MDYTFECVHIPNSAHTTNAIMFVKNKTPTKRLSSLPIATPSVPTVVVPAKPWTPLPLKYEDLHETLPLTCRFLALLPQPKIHPTLIHVFGYSVCERGNAIKNDEYKREARDVAAQFPPISVFKDTLVDKLTLSIPNEKARSVAFVLALLEVSGRSKLTLNEKVILEAIRLEIRSVPTGELKDKLLTIVLVLIEWEWKDRTQMAIDLLDMGFQFSVHEERLMWCVMAFKDTEYRNRIIEHLRTAYGLWHTREEIEERTVASPYDLAVFVTALSSVGFSEKLADKPWMRRLRKALRMEETMIWTVNDVIHSFFCAVSTFGVAAMISEYLTAEQRIIMLCSGLTPGEVLTPEEFIVDILFTVEDIDQITSIQKPIQPFPPPKPTLAPPSECDART